MGASPREGGPVPCDPESETPDYLPALPPEDRWFEDDPSPALMRDLPAYPAVPADDRTRGDPFAPRSPVPATVALLLVTAGIAALTLLLEWSLREGK